MNIKNYEKVLEELTTMLMQFAKDLNKYQTDVYMYYDEETEEATLDTFVNVGGNSWLNDAHYTIYSDREHFDSFLEEMTSSGTTLSDVADILGITKAELRKKAAEYLEYEEDEIGDFEIYKFLEEDPEYSEELYNYYVSEIETDTNGYYAEQAVAILDRFEEDYENINL